MGIHPSRKGRARHGGGQTPQQANHRPTRRTAPGAHTRAHPKERAAGCCQLRHHHSQMREFVDLRRPSPLLIPVGATVVMGKESCRSFHNWRMGRRNYHQGLTRNAAFSAPCDHRTPGFTRRRPVGHEKENPTTQSASRNGKLRPVMIRPLFAAGRLGM